MEFNAYITNLRKYNEGELVGKWVSLPVTPQELKQVFREIGIGKRYEEFFITDYECDISELINELGEYENLEELNYLANRMDGLENFELKEFETILDAGLNDQNGIVGLINLTNNLPGYWFYPDINDEYDLGYYYIEESGRYDTESLGTLKNYIDYERYGRDMSLEEGGAFTNTGYVLRNEDAWVNMYVGQKDSIPDEYKLFEPMRKMLQRQIQHQER